MVDRAFSSCHQYIDRMMHACVAKPLFLSKTVCAKNGCNVLGKGPFSCRDCCTMYCSYEHRREDEQRHNYIFSKYHHYQNSNWSQLQPTHVSPMVNFERMMYAALEHSTKEIVERALFWCRTILNQSTQIQTSERFFRITWPALLLRLGNYETCYNFICAYTTTADRLRIHRSLLEFNIYATDETQIEPVLCIPLMLIKIRLYYSLTLIEEAPHFIGIDSDRDYASCKLIRSYIAPVVAPETLKYNERLITNDVSRKKAMKRIKLQIENLYDKINSRFPRFWSELINLVDRRTYHPIYVSENSERRFQATPDVSEYDHARTMYALVWSETPFAMKMTMELFNLGSLTLEDLFI